MDAKYFVYLSDTKVNMLFTQIPRSLKSKIATEIEIDLQFLRTTFRDRDNQDQETRYSKLQVVLKHIEGRNIVGTIESSKPYFKGELDMRWGEFPETGLVYFTGMVNDTILGLGGSLKHVIGKQSIEHLETSGSSSYGIQRSLIEELGLEPLVDELRRETYGGGNRITNVDKEELTWTIEDAYDRIRGGIKNRVEFVARRLFEDKQQPPKVVLGTPIYVAYAD
jgi:hypothetical protein